MSKLSKVLLLISGVIVIPVMLVVVVLRVLDMDSYKRQLQDRASEASGMNVSLVGPLLVSLFPHARVVLNELQVAKEDREIATVSRIDIGFDLWPLFRKEFQINSLTLHEPVISVARLEDGTFNIQRPARYNGTLPTLDLEVVTVNNATIRLADAITGAEYEARECDIEINDAALVDSTREDILRNLALAAELDCTAISRDMVAMDDVHVVINGSQGKFVVDPMTMNLFGGGGSGAVQIDFMAEPAAYDVEYGLPQFQTGKFLEAFFPQQTITGNTSFAAQLTMQGNTIDELKQTLSGGFSLRGDALILHGINLDHELAEFASTQNFSLIDMGAVFFAGPLGLAVTKGYDYASLFQKSDSNSEITKLISDWTVTNGIAQAQDVAMTTAENLIALDGSLDLHSSRFNELTVALLDSRGCASVQQVIRGSFREPEIEKPGFLMALAGPALSLIKQGVEMLPGEECEPFYKGSLAPQSQ
jgi:AsmA protein